MARWLNGQILSRRSARLPHAGRTLAAFHFVRAGRTVQLARGAQETAAAVAPMFAVRMTMGHGERATAFSDPPTGGLSARPGKPWRAGDWAIERLSHCFFSPLTPNP